MSENLIALKVALTGNQMVEAGLQSIADKIKAQEKAFTAANRSAKSAVESVQAFSRVGSLLGNSQFAAIAAAADIAAASVKGVKEGFEALSGFGAAKLGGIGAIIAGISAIGVFYAKYATAAKAASVATAGLSSANDKLATSIERVVTARLAAGELTTTQAEEARAILERAKQLQKTSPEISRQLLLGTAGQVRKESAPPFTQAAADAKRGLGLARVEAGAEVERARIEKENELARQQFETQLIQLDGYLARKRQLAIESNKTEIGVIEKQEFDLKAALLTQDAAGKFKTLADIEGLHASRKVLGLKLEGDLNRITAEGEKERARLREQAAREEEQRKREAVQKARTENNQVIARQEKEQFEIVLARHKLESDFALTSVEKRQRLIETIARETEQLRLQIVELEKRKALLAPGDTENGDLLDGQITGLTRRRDGLGNEQSGLGADPNSFGEQLTSKFTEMQNRFGTIAQSMASTITGTIGTAIDSVSNGIAGLIMGTQTWGQALRAIGSEILTTVVQSFVKMALQWVVSQVFMAGVSNTVEATRTIVSVAGSKARAFAYLGEAEAIGVATAAAAAGSVASVPYIGAALAAVAFASTLGMINAAILVATAANVAGFASGGYTGNAPTSQAVGPVHGQEFVFSAPAVNRIGLGNLEAMHNGGSPAGVGVMGRSSANITNVTLADESAIRQFMKGRGRDEIINIVRGSKRELGLA